LRHCSRQRVLDRLDNSIGSVELNTVPALLDESLFAAQ
jgi:hypothetical protein